MSCSLSPTAEFIALSFGVGRNMTVIDRRTRQPAADFKSSGYAVFSPNGKYLAVACVPDSVIEIRETKEWSLLSTLLCEVPQAAMTFSADSTYFASGGRSGGGIQVWQTSNWQLTNRLPSLHTSVGLAFDATNSRLVSVSIDEESDFLNGSDQGLTAGNRTQPTVQLMSALFGGTGKCDLTMWNLNTASKLWSVSQRTFPSA